MRIGVLSDTHIHLAEEIPPEVVKAFSEVPLGGCPWLQPVRMRRVILKGSPFEGDPLRCNPYACAESFLSDLVVEQRGKLLRDMKKNEGTRGQLIGPYTALAPIDKTPTYAEMGITYIIMSTPYIV